MAYHWHIGDTMDRTFVKKTCLTKRIVWMLGRGSGNFNSYTSAKALKAGVNDLFEGRIFQINSTDDAVYRNGNLSMKRVRHFHYRYRR